MLGVLFSSFAVLFFSPQKKISSLSIFHLLHKKISSLNKDQNINKRFALFQFFISLGQAERAERWRREPQKVPENLDDNLDLGGDEDRNVFEDQGVVNEDFDGVEDDGDDAEGDDGQIC